MNLKQLIAKVNSKSSEHKEALHRALEEDKIMRIVEQRRKSSNERELERFLNERREEQIKEHLDIMRKEKEHDIAFNHNPLNIKNITNHTAWEVLREPNMFSSQNFENSVLRQRNIFVGVPNVTRGGRMQCL